MSSFGIQFTNTANAKVIDGRRLLPQLIGRYDLASFGYYDSALGNADFGVHPGYILRTYNFNPNLNNRPYLAFMTLPGNTTAFAAGGGNTMPGPAIMYAPGASFAAPQVYCFALDYVSASGAAWGMQVFGDGGSPLIYDSGNKHLNINQISPAVNVDRSWPSALQQKYPSAGITSTVLNVAAPAKPAFVIPSFEVNKYYQRRNSNGGYLFANGFFRFVNGNAIQSILLRNDTEYDGEIYDNNFETSWSSASSSVNIPIIDASIFD